MVYLRSLTGLWISNQLAEWPHTVHCMRHIRKLIYCRKFLHIWAYSLPISHIQSHTVAYLEPCATLAYSEPCHFQNPDIFRTQDIFRTLLRHILAYSEHCVTIAYWETRILAYLGPEAYSESSLFNPLY